MDVRRCDYDDPASLDGAFAGADRLLLVSASGIGHEERAGRHRNAIDAAVRAGVGRVYYTSLLPGDGSVAYVMKAHLDTEAYLGASGLNYTVLRNGAYAEAWALYLGESGEVAVPADGPVSWVSRDDLAEGIARLLLRGGGDEVLSLTGSEALDLRAVAAMQGRPFRLVTAAEYVDRARDKDRAGKWVSTYEGLVRGEWAAVDPFLGGLLGRPLRTMREVLSS